MKRFLSILLIGILFLSGCGKEPAPTEPSIPSETTLPTETAVPVTEAPVETTVPPTTAPAATGTLTFNTYDITFRAEGESWGLYNGTLPAQYVTFTSDDANIATFENGIVTAVSPGTTHIRAEFDGDSISCIIRCAFKASDRSRDPVTAPPEVFEGTAHYFDDAVFVGDSVSLMLSYYAADTGLLGDAQFLVRGSYSVAHALNGTMLMTYRGQQLSLPDAIAATGAKKVFFMLGMNDIGLNGIDATMESWETLLWAVKKVCPEVEIVIQSMTPVYTGGEKGKLNNPNVDAYNARLQAFAEEAGYGYLDVASFMKDATGGLAERYCSDQYVHLTTEGAATWVKVLKAYSEN